MATLFLSHSNKDDGLARSLQAWLNAEGFDDFFVDHSSILGGDKWADALRAAKASCRVVLCLVTPHWLASDACNGEFMAAWYLGKRIIPLIACAGAVLSEEQQRRFSRVIAEDQGFDVSLAIVDGQLSFERIPETAELLAGGLKAGGALAKIGLDPEAFAIDTALRPSPYPGLESFDDSDADAAIFYGRTPEILRSLEDLREMRANGSLHPYIIIGASGSGKSSLLRAGILPRLRRERGWIVLRAFRPGAEPLLNFCSAILRTFEDPGMSDSGGSFRDELQAAWEKSQKVRRENPKQADETLSLPINKRLDLLRVRFDRPHATILVPLDQAEELVHATAGHGADILADCLRALLSPPAGVPASGQSTPKVLFCLTIRTDSLPALQASARFAGLASRSSDLRPVPIHRFSVAIEGPAKRYGVEIEPGLVEAMIEDTPDEDALPLLAFALQRLWKQYSAAKMLRRSAYEALGKLSGMISDAAERALAGLHPQDDKPVPSAVPADVEQLAARTFVPPLAQVTDSGVAVRRVASTKKFNERAIPLLERFLAWRLLVQKQAVDTSESTVEVAHEAIFRSWPRLRNWVEAERVRLQVLRDVDDAASGWQAHSRRGAYLDHRGDRLQQALGLFKVDDFATQLSELAQDYLNACRWAQIKRRAVAGLVATLAMLAAFAGYATYDNLAMQQVMRRKASILVRGGYPTAAAKFSIAGAVGDFDATKFLTSDLGDASISETGFIMKSLIDLPVPYSVDKYVLTDDGRRLIVQSADEIGSIWDIESRRKLTDLGDVRSVANFYLASNQSRLITQSTDSSLAIWDVETGARIGGSDTKMYKSGKIVSARMTTLSEENTCMLWDLTTGKVVATIGREHEVDWCQISDTGTHVLTRSVRFAAALWNATSGQWIANIGQDTLCYSCQFGSLANRIFLMDPDGKASLFDMTSGGLVKQLSDPDRMAGATFSPNGKRFVTRSVRSNLTLWNAENGERIASIGSSDANSYNFTDNGAQIMTRSSDGSGELREADKGALLRAFPAASVKQYKLSKRGDRLVTVSFDKAATLWNSATGEKITSLAGKRATESVVFSSDGTRLSVGSDTTPGGIWNSSTGKKMTDFETEGADGGGIFSKDASRYVSLSANNYATFWNAAEGKLITLLGGEGAASDADVADDNRHVVTNSIASTASVWDLSILAEARAGRPTVRSQVCDMNYSVIGAFGEDQRDDDDEDTIRLATYLVGRPWHPCDWRGLLSLQGWAQELRYWAVKAGLPWDYKCGERRAIGRVIDPNASCEELDTDAARPAKPKSSSQK